MFVNPDVVLSFHGPEPSYQVSSGLSWGLLSEPPPHPPEGRRRAAGRSQIPTTMPSAPSTPIPRGALALGATAALGGLLFGFDIAIITGAGPFLLRHFQLDALGLGWAFSSLLFGCVLGSAITGWIADHRGRRLPMLWVAALFALTSVATGLAPSYAVFIAARFVGGLAVGAVSLLAPMYVSEVSPATSRGRMGALYQMAIVVGILVSYSVNYALRDLGSWNWRWMFLSGAVPSVLFWVILYRAPDSPRYLVLAGRGAERLFGRAFLA